MNKELQCRPTPEHKLFYVYHNHEYGGSSYLLWSTIHPSEDQVVESLENDSEPEKEYQETLDKAKALIEALSYENSVSQEKVYTA